MVIFPTEIVYLTAGSVVMEHMLLWAAAPKIEIAFPARRERLMMEVKAATSSSANLGANLRAKKHARFEVEEQLKATHVA